MKKITLAFAVAMAFVSVGCKKKGGDAAGGAMAKMTEFKDEMCKCKDMACAQGVSDKMMKWSQEQAKNVKEPPKMSEADTKKAMEVGEAMSKCMQTAMGAGGAAPAPAAGGEAAPAAGGEAAPAAAAPAAGGAKGPDAATVCKKLEDLATKEGGKAKKEFDEGLKKDCAKEIDEQRGKKGEAAITEFVACLDKVDSLTKAMETCKQID